MTPQTFIEMATDLQAAQFHEWAGREYARSVSRPYPIPPESWPGSDEEPPTAIPLYAYTLWWSDPIPKLGGGAVYKLDDELVGFATQPQTLSDGHEYFCDLAIEAKTFAQLSPEGQLAATPPPPPDL
jgi:hypothetical protein